MTITPGDLEREPLTENSKLKTELQRLNLQLKTDNCKLKTFYANPLIFKKNCSTFAVRFMGYLQGCRGSGKFFK
ncbi:hypothetical protein CA265_17025 [Sphingobacteriaceae bacterium GW460-11-11-14-LB5]|nr:hypothetical protein CA265_17025 [Sphingobacteriaceae bacterium GW460-11-11-14-LB5]